jgi:Flp pilus assembly protein TadG
MDAGQHRHGRPSRSHSRRGVTAVEFVMVLILALSMIFGVVEYARILFVKTVMAAGADAGARRAAAGTGTLVTADIVTTVKGVMGGVWLPSQVIRVYATDSTGNPDPAISDWRESPFGTGIAVEVELDYPVALPSFGILPNPIHLRVRSIACSEAN